MFLQKSNYKKLVLKIYLFELPYFSLLAVYPVLNDFKNNSFWMTYFKIPYFQLHGHTIPTDSRKYLSYNLLTSRRHKI